MKTFYELDTNGKLVSQGSALVIPTGATEYVVGSEPQELIDARLAEIADYVPEVITMRQARLALLQSGLLTTVSDAIINGTDETMKIEWEYATEVRRDWTSLIALATSLSLTSADLDGLFVLAESL